MRRVATGVESRESHSQFRMDSRFSALRKARLRTLALESLESRLLMAMLPPITPDPSAPTPIDLAKSGSGVTVPDLFPNSPRPLVLASTGGVASKNPPQITVDAVAPATPPAPDLAGNASPMGPGLTVTIDATVPATPPPPVLVTDTGTFNNDDVTNANNSATSPSPSNAPVFNILNVEPNATVVLYRNNLEVGRINLTAGGTVAIADLNGGSSPGQDPIADGIYVYRVQQIDQAGNPSQLSSGLTVTIDHTAPLSPAPPALELASDTSNGFNHTTRNNNPSPASAPVFDVGGVEANATVILFRAPVVGGVVGTFTQVNSIAATAGGTVAIADLNSSDNNGKIADGSYVYEAQQVDLAGNVGPMTSNSVTITIDTTAPTPPVAPVLDKASDTGVSNTDGITGITATGFPVFDISGVEGNATVKLFRLPPGGSSAILVGTVTALAGATSVSITDTYSPIPDGTYLYTTQQVDQAGNASALSLSTRVIYDTSQPPTPGVATVDPGSQTGGNTPPPTSVRSPSFNVNVSGAEINSSVTLLRDGQIVASGPYTVTSGTVQITDPGPVGDGPHTYQTFLTDLAGNTGALSGSLSVTFAPDTPGAPVLDPASDSGTKGDNLTNVTEGLIFDVATATAGDTVKLFRNGQLVGTHVGPGPITDPGPVQPDGVYTYTAQQIDPFGTISQPSTPLSVTIVTTGTTPTLALDPSSDSGAKGDGITNINGSAGVFPKFNITNVLAGTTLTLVRNGVAVQTLKNAPAGAVSLTDFNGGSSMSTGSLIADGVYVYTVQQLDTIGNSATSPTVTVQITTSAAAPAALALDPGSDTGPIGDNITGSRSPVFDVASVPAGATLNLLRDGVVVATATGGKVAIADPGPLLDGQYAYTAILTDGAGNVSPASAPLNLSVVTVKGDYNGDGKADPSVFRRVGGGEADWFVAGGIVPPGSPAFGSGTLDVPFQGDLDGDGRTDLILYRPSTSQWFVQQSSQGFVQYTFGAVGDLPMVGDFDGVGHDELAVYRPSTGQWFVAGHGSVFATFGGPDDVPVPLRNYYGNGKDALAVFRPSTAQWLIAGLGVGISFGGRGDLPVPLFNYYGNGKDALAVFRPSTAQWFVAGQGVGIGFGGQGDVPVSADFDGIGRDEIGVYRPSTGQWFVSGHSDAIAAFGASSDIPLEAPYPYRALSGINATSRPASSMTSLDPEVNATAPSVGSGATQGAAITPPAATPPASPGARRVRSTRSSIPSVVASGIRSGHGQRKIHDAALATLGEALGPSQRPGV